MSKLGFVVVLGLMLDGCGYKQVTTCKKCKDGVCVVNKLSAVKLCNKPLIIDNKTYCR